MLHSCSSSSLCLSSCVVRADFSEKKHHSNTVTVNRQCHSTPKHLSLCKASLKRTGNGRLHETDREIVIETSEEGATPTIEELTDD
ncbi:hypothetical protein KIN20_038358 [Parelaphostrongylus tenuis]|uniref:Uncharacterized protein n=1 Tax=Parelaphostrongylus tenuis TaxID=148309 RepID=A0AAD5REQ7_PARTN|nr:hypothetical protein KIN20_038358 [Parelaphostrongylus tenuis]